MPIDIQNFRVDQGGNPDKVRESQKKRYKDVNLVDEIIEFDNKQSQAREKLDGLNKEARQCSIKIGDINKNAKKQKRKPNETELKEIESLKLQKTNIESKQTSLLNDFETFITNRDKLLSKIGNLVPKHVPVSQDEKDNGLIKRWGNPRLNQNNKFRHHHELLWMIGGYEPDRGVSVCGHRGYFLTGPGVILNLALQNYGINFLLKKKYTPVYPPFFMNKDVMAKTAQLEDFNEALYHVSGESSDTDKYLIATSEQPISAMHYNEWMNSTELPIRYAGVSTNFRKEAGSHGKDAWGIFRVHQFDKIEQFVYCEPDQSWKFHKEMLGIAEEFYQSLKIPYEVVNIVSGKLNNAAAKKYNLEGWFPTLGLYRELVSCSNCTDYQSRAMNTRFGFPKKGDRQKEYVHMLNATLCATTRTICCILENYQTDCGIHVPDVLQPYCGGEKFFAFVRPSPNKQAQKSNKGKGKGKKKGKEKSDNKGKNKNEKQNTNQSHPKSMKNQPNVGNQNAK